MKFSDVMIYFDYKMYKIAEALNIRRQSITRWRQNHKVPYAKQCELEILTEGKLKADKND